jgi:hypothetical protein
VKLQYLVYFLKAMEYFIAFLFGAISCCPLYLLLFFCHPEVVEGQKKQKDAATIRARQYRLMQAKVWAKKLM